MIFSILFLQAALAASPAGGQVNECDVVDSFENQSVVCADREVELFLKGDEKITSLALKLKDGQMGREQTIQVRKTNLKASDLKSLAGKDLMKNKTIEKEIKKIQKEWGVLPEVEVIRLELDRKAKYFASKDFQKEIKPRFFAEEKRSVASNKLPEIKVSGLARARHQGVKK